MLDVMIDKRELHRLTRSVADLPGMFDRARTSALKSLGYHIRQDLKHAPVKPVLSPYTGTLARKRVIRPLKHPRYRSGPRKGLVKPRLSRRTMPFARLKNMVRYEVDASDGLVAVGLLKQGYWTKLRMSRHAEGYSVGVTPKMRRLFFALGLPLRRGKSALRVPARPWIRTVKAQWHHRATPFFEEKFWAALRRYRGGE